MFKEFLFLSLSLVFLEFLFLGCSPSFEPGKLLGSESTPLYKFMGSFDNLFKIHPQDANEITSTQYEAKQLPSILSNI